MPTNVLMPQMGESIAEGTIVKWFKSVGDQVTKDEPLLEISTDKVDAEVPAPATGVLAQILHGPGTTVAVESAIAVIALPGEAPGSAPVPVQAAAAPAPAAAPEPPAPAPVGVAAVALAPTPVAPAPAPVATPSPVDEEGELLRQRSSPLVRRIARERHGH
jgi:pyruvate dehydrogenase E2 component (dihydrolipoamide acetyltransferase)